MDIDKLIRRWIPIRYPFRFGSLMDIDKLIPKFPTPPICNRFGSLMDIDKRVPSSDVFHVAIQFDRMSYLVHESNLLLVQRRIIEKHEKTGIP